MTQESVALIDGSGLLHRAFHGVRTPLTRPDGMPVGALMGFMNLLARLMEQHTLKQGAVVFDTSRRTFRHELDPTYKAQRHETPAELILQFQEAMKACEALGWPVVKADGVEADDIIATLAHQEVSKGQTTIIYSSDKDFIQLLQQGIRLYDPFKEVWVTDETVLQRYGVAPSHFLDLQALMGDSSDNVKGVPSVGPKTAALLLKQFGNLEALLNNVDQIANQRLRGIFETHPHAARHAHNLLKLRQDVPLTPVDLTLRSLDTTGLLAFLDHNHFIALKKRFEKGFLAQSFAGSPPQAAAIEYTLLDSSQAEAWLKQAYRFGRVGLATDSSGIAAALPSGEVIQTTLQDLENPCTQVIQAVIQDETLIKICADVKGFWHHMAPSGWISPRARRTAGLWEDIVLMSALCGQKSGAATLSPPEQAAFSLLKEHHLLRQSLCALGQMVLYSTLEKPLLAILYDMECTGILLDTEALNRYGRQVDLSLQDLEHQLYTLAGQTFNLASPQQLSAVLESRLSPQQRATIKKTKQGALHTDAETLEALDQDPFITAMLAWRQLQKIKTTYTDTLPQHRDTEGRIHTTYLSSGARTGRLSSLNPNMQNIPTVRSAPIRQAFMAMPGWQLVSFDYAHIELRLLAHMGPVDLLKQAFQQGIDVHAQTASQVFDVAIDQVDADLRRQGKILNFSILYGLSGFRLANQLGISTSQANAIIQRFLTSDPGFHDYINRCKEEARSKGYVTTLLGRRCFIPRLQGSYPARSAAERQAVNAPLQGSSADIMKKAMVDLSPLLQKFSSTAHLLLQVHDELIFEINPQITDLFISEVHRVLVSTVTLSVPLQVDCQIGETWGSLHPYKLIIS